MANHRNQTEEDIEFLRVLMKQEELDRVDDSTPQLGQNANSTVRTAAKESDTPRAWKQSPLRLSWSKTVAP